MSDKKFKRLFIEDPIWEQIEMFPWEMDILNHFIFNRLHDIIQNSCAYMVFPNMRHSRFIHSIGTVHVVTEMFVNCIINIKNEINILKNEIEEFKQKKEKINNKNIFENGINEITEKLAQKIEIFNEIKKECKTVKKKIEANNTTEQEIICSRTKCPKEFALLLAVIRLAALLHDVGHLPYSHVFEFALENFLKNKNTENERLQEHKSTLNKHFKITHNVQRKPLMFSVYPEKIHETIRNHLICIMKTRNNDFTDKILESVLCLWKDINFLPICYRMLDADIDADRLDFVRRDAESSGLFKSSIDFERLFSNYELEFCKNPQDPQKTDNPLMPEKSIKPRPSRRSNAESEKVLWERHLVYKYIVGHHKVHLFDEILKRLISQCINEERLNDLLDALDSICAEWNNEESNQNKSSTIAEDEKKTKAKKIIKNYFNDSWINIKLQEMYEKTEDKKIKILYETFTEDRKRFISLFKSDEHYYGNKNISDFIKGKSRSKKDDINVEKYLKENKDNLEEALEKKFDDIVIIIGVLNSGLNLKKMKKQNTAKFFGLENLGIFFDKKTEESRPLNIWYYSKEGKNLETEKKIFDFLNEKVTEEKVREMQA